MNHPHFTMSKFATQEDLYKAKAKYFEAKYEQLERDVKKIIYSYRYGYTDYGAMETVQDTVKEDNCLTG